MKPRLMKFREPNGFEVAEQIAKGVNPDESIAAAKHRLDVQAWLENSNGCEGPCTTPESPVIVGPDPYQFEIHGDDTPRRLCVECRLKSRLEI